MGGYAEDLERDGFVIVRSLFRGEKLEILRAAAARAEAQARRGEWPYVRTVGKQFPPWPSSSSEHGIWGVQHLLHPSLPDHEVFTRLYFSDELLGVTKQLLGCADAGVPLPTATATATATATDASTARITDTNTDGSADTNGGDGDSVLVMELLNMLVRPDGGAWELRWHRDDIGPDVSGEEEMRRLARPAFHAQFNLALAGGDDSLVVVPGSHRRARTAGERAAGAHDELEGEARVVLGAGDMAFYDHNILHRGVYDGESERLTVHGSVGHVDGGELRARVVLQHGVREWVGGMDLGRMDWGWGGGDEAEAEGERLRARAEGMRERLLKLGRESGDVGFSLDG